MKSKFQLGKKLSVNEHYINIYFSFGRNSCSSFSMLFPKAPAFYGKNILK